MDHKEPDEIRATDAYDMTGFGTVKIEWNNQEGTPAPEVRRLAAEADVKKHPPYEWRYGSADEEEDEAPDPTYGSPKERELFMRHIAEAVARRVAQKAVEDFARNLAATSSLPYRIATAAAQPGAAAMSNGQPPNASDFEQPIFRPELAHTTRHNRNQGTWDVLGPDGYYKLCHHEDEAEALAAFWSGDHLRAEEYRRRALGRRGLLKDDEL